MFLFNSNSQKDKTYVVIGKDFDRARKSIWKELYRHYQRDSEEPSIIREIKALTINGTKIKETIRGNIRLVENIGRDYLCGYVYSRLNPLESIKIVWLISDSNFSKMDGEKYKNIKKIIISDNSGFHFFIKYFKKYIDNNVEIKVEV